MKLFIAAFLIAVFTIGVSHAATQNSWIEHQASEIADRGSADTYSYSPGAFSGASEATLNSGAQINPTTRSLSMRPKRLLMIPTGTTADAVAQPLSGGQFEHDHGHSNTAMWAVVAVGVAVMVVMMVGMGGMHH